MSLYYEAAAALSAPASDGGNLKTRIFGPRSKDAKDRKDTKDAKDAKDSKDRTKRAPPAQVYALAVEACKWSAVLSEVIDRAELLAQHVRAQPTLTPVLALLLVHDLLVGKAGAVQLPAQHGLRAAVERHKTRLAAELTRARLRRRAPTLQALREQVEVAAAERSGSSSQAASLAASIRWVRINTLRSALDAQLATTFADYERVASLPELFGNGQAAAGEERQERTSSGRPGHRIYVDEHVPNLVAVPLVTTASSSAAASSDLTRSEAYKGGAIIFQDKASCFPAYLLDPAFLTAAGGGDIIDACAAPGNKTSHLAALIQESSSDSDTDRLRHVFAFEKDTFRAKTLQTMLRKAGALDGGGGGGGGGDSISPPLVTVYAGQDFLKVDPADACFRRVRALLLDPSCSGSGIVGRDAMPELRLPKAFVMGAGGKTTVAHQARGTKRKRKGGSEAGTPRIPAAAPTKGGRRPESAAEAEPPSNDSDNDASALETDETPARRLAALASFQLSLLLHAMSFPAAERVTYSTCSVHAQENEAVVVQALQSVNGGGRGWRLLRRDEQVAGMRAWPVRGERAAVKRVAEEEGSHPSTEIDAAVVADACIRSYPDDGRGVMGFFVAAFVREGGVEGREADQGEEAEGDEDEWGGFDD